MALWNVDFLQIFIFRAIFWKWKEINNQCKNESCSVNQYLSLCKISGPLENFWKSYGPLKCRFFCKFSFFGLYFENETRQIISVRAKVAQLTNIYHFTKFQVNQRISEKVMALWNVDFLQFFIFRAILWKWKETDNQYKTLWT